MIKKLLSLLLILVLLIPGFAAAETQKQENETTGYIAVIDDSASLLDRAEYDGVMETMMNITEYCNTGLYTYSGGSTEYVMTNNNVGVTPGLQGYMDKETYKILREDLGYDGVVCLDWPLSAISLMHSGRFTCFFSFALIDTGMGVSTIRIPPFFKKILSLWVRNGAD